MRKQEQGESEGMRATSSTQGNPDLPKENIFTRVVEHRRRELSYAERGAGAMSGLEETSHDSNLTAKQSLTFGLALVGAGGTGPRPPEDPLNPNHPVMLEGAW